MSDALPTELSDRFEALGELGRGGMAVVHLVRDRRTGEECALKVIHPHVLDQPSARRRVERELEASRRVQHPQVLEVQELIELPGSLALRMAALRGGTLIDQVEAHGPVSAGSVARLLDDVGGALAAAHARGVLHRDVSPANIMVHDNDYLLADFGLARLAEQHSATATSALGTPGYAAPEAWEGPSRDPRSDAFSLGAALYYAATGEAPYGGGTALGALQRQLAGDLVPVRAHRDDLPEPLSQTIEALLHPDPERRPSVEDALRQVLPEGAQDAHARGDAPEPAGDHRLQRTQLGSALSLLALVGVGWFQDLGPFLLSTIVDGHAIPKPDVFEMSQGVSGLLLLPLALMPAVIGFVAGRKKDLERRLAPWVSMAALSILVLLYAVAAGVILPEMGMRGTADIFGTMLFHLGAWVPASTALVLMARPWKGLRAAAPALSSEESVQTEVVDSLEERARSGLRLLQQALGRAPDAVRLDLSDHVQRLEEEVEALEASRRSLEESRRSLAPDEAALGRLQGRLTRARTLGQPTSALEEALAAHEAAQVEVAALDEQLVAQTARLLHIRAAAAQAHRGLVEHAPSETVQVALDELRARADLVARARREVAQS